MSRTDIFSAVFLLAFALAFGFQAGMYPQGELKRVGPGFFPLILAVLLGLLSLLLLFASLPRRLDGKRMAGPAQWGGIISVLAALFAYGFLLRYLGFPLTTFLFSLFLLKYGYPGKWLLPLGGALATTVFTFIIFKVWLGTPFPAGIIGF